MSIIIHEFLDSNSILENFKEVTHNNEDISITEAMSEQSIDPNSLMVDVEAIHAMPHSTRNFTRYTEKCLKNSLRLWTNPYSRPLIKHHNEKNGDIIGRVIDASYKNRDTFSGTGALVLTLNVPGEQAKQDVKNGINQTVSIGVIAEDVRCSICGKQIELDNNGNVISCDHVKGEVYNKETAYWDIYAMEPKEVSYVIVPSDIYARNIKSYPATKNNISRVEENLNITENLDDSKGEIKGMDIKEMEAKLKNAEDKVEGLTAGMKAITESKDIFEQKNKELIEQLNIANKLVNTKEEEITVLKNKIDTLESNNATLGTQLNDLKEQKKTIEEQFNNTVKMQEGLEAELASIKISLKESLTDNLQALRKIAGKQPLSEEVLKNREESSIRDSIQDLKLEISESIQERKFPEQVNSPALAEEAISDNKDVQKDTHISNDMSLKEGLESIFMAVAGAHR